MQHSVNRSDIPRPVAIALSADAWLAGAEAALCKSGQRLTVTRQAILAWIAGIETSFTAETLVAVLEHELAVSSRPTIYRTVEWLASAGWLVRITRTTFGHSYARALPHCQQTLVCLQCGVVVVLSNATLERALAPLLDQLPFEIQQQALELHGVCQSCQTHA